ncbi:UNVERIFIED_CONTAM: hypothetical protein Slati_2774800 [Sesamum latifolium]|uniref:Reverse transcriptase n=1 Tax=Sesamum latifolium TaxID=2727402 RepID=A0AAW2VZX4_9LAMI
MEDKILRQPKKFRIEKEDLDLIEEKRETTRRRVSIYKCKMAKAYDSKVRPRKFEMGDLVLRKTENTGPVGKLDAKWDGPYIIAEVIGPGTYKLKKGMESYSPERGT